MAHGTPSDINTQLTPTKICWANKMSPPTTTTCDGTCQDFADHLRGNCFPASQCPTVAHEDAFVVALRDLTVAVRELTEKIEEMFEPELLSGSES